MSISNACASSSCTRSISATSGSIEAFSDGVGKRDNVDMERNPRKNDSPGEVYQPTNPKTTKRFWSPWKACVKHSMLYPAVGLSHDNLFNVPRRYGKSSPMGIPHVIIVALGTRLTRCIRCVAAAALGFLHQHKFIGMPLVPFRANNAVRSR